MRDAEAGFASLGAERDLLAEAAREAADLALTYFRRDVKSWMKEGNSPVSEADLALDRLLHRRLLAARPGYGWLSEETADSPARLAPRRLFVVDPIDGTRAFIAGKADWSVSLALVEDGRPVAAALVAPVSGDFYLAASEHGATRNGAVLAATAAPAPNAARAASAKAQLGHRVPEFAEVVPRIASLALRLASVGAGDIDAAFAGVGAHDWDIAAADLIVTEAGGRLSGFDGAAPAYNRAESLRHPALVAAGPALHGRLLAFAAGR